MRLWSYCVVIWGDGELRDRPSQPPSHELVQKIKESIRERVMSIDPTEWPGTEALIDEVIHRWSTTRPSRYGGFGRPDEEIPLMYPAGGQQHPRIGRIGRMQLRVQCAMWTPNARLALCWAAMVSGHSP